MFKFEHAVEYVLKHEGGLSENPNDAGGITNFGISWRFLKSLSVATLKGYGIYVDDGVTQDDVRLLSIEQAKDIYLGEFWNHSAFEKIETQDVCNYVFDMAVNMGINPSIKCAQRATWAVMRKREIIKDDGILGPKSIQMINQCGTVLLYSLRSERAGYYRIVAEKPEQDIFLMGWLNRAYGG